MTLIRDTNTDSSLNGWLLTPAMNLIGFVSDGLIVAAITHRALLSFSMLPKLISAAKLAIPDASRDTSAALDNLRTMVLDDADFAKAEEQRDFSTIFSHHLVSTWAAIETTIEQTLINHLINVGDSVKRIADSGITLKRKQTISSRRDAKKVIQIWNSQIDIQDPIDRSLVKLSLFGLKVVLDTTDKNALSEMCAARNIFAHNAGFVDDEFLEKCPWLNYQKGERFRLNFELMQRYFDAASRFAIKMVEASTTSSFFQSQPDTVTTSPQNGL